MGKVDGPLKKTGEDEVGGEWSFDPKTVLARYRKWFPELSDEILLKILTFQADLVKFNRTINLVSPSTIRNAEVLHFADSIHAVKIIAKNLVPNEPLYDVASGNGFPGLVAAILFPEVKVIILETDPRKLEFLKHVIGTAKIPNASAQAVVFEALGENSVANVVIRAEAPLHKAMLLARKQVRKGGRFFHMKGDGWANELAAVPTQLFSHWAPSLLGQYRIPELSGDLAVVLTEKSTS